MVRSKRIIRRQKLYCVKPLRKEKNIFFANLDIKNIAKNITFWQTEK